MTNRQFIESVKRSIKFPVLFAENGFPLPDSIELGIVFIHATWSGASIASLQNLTNAINQLKFCSIKLFVLSADDLDYQRFQNYYGNFPSSGGWGEAFWIKEGKLAHADSGYYKENYKDKIERRLIEFCPEFS